MKNYNNYRKKQSLVSECENVGSKKSGKNPPNTETFLQINSYVREIS